MENMDCDIIQDLIPSYVDEICSEATRRCVDEHIKTCSACQQIVKFCKNSTFSEKKLEQWELDGMKKIRRKMKMQNMVSYLLVLIMIAFGIWLFLINRNTMSYNAYYSLFAVCMAANVLAGVSHKRMNQPEKAELITGGISFAADIYIVSVFFYCFKMLETGTMPFGLEPVQCGPFLHWQIMAVFAAQILFFLYHLIGMLKKDKNSSWLLCLDMMGVFLAMGEDWLLGNMNTFEGFAAGFTQMTFVTAVIGCIGIAASIIITKCINP